MSNEYLVNSEDMTSVADAIRTKGGTSEALSFPDGFVEAVGAIQADGGIQLNRPSAKEINGLTPFEINDENVTVLKGFMYSNVGRIVCPNVITLDKLQDCKKLEYLDLSSIVNIDQYALSGCVALKNVIMPKVKLTGQRTFSGCTSLEYIRLDSTIRPGGWQWSFSDCTALKKAIFPSAADYIGAGTFSGCVVLEAVVLGSVNSTTLCTLSNVNAFQNTPLTGYGGTYSGHIYVPSALIAEYQAATNWATLFEAYPEIFQPIEGSEYEE